MKTEKKVKIIKRLLVCPLLSLCLFVCACTRVRLTAAAGSSLASPRLGAAAQFGMHRDSYNLTNWKGAGFGLNLS